jgi:tetratricopeptide (TPR) repeat protein
MKRYDDAIVEYIKAIKLDPSDPHLYYNLSVAFYSKEDYAKALKTIERALSIQPGFTEGSELKTRVEAKLSSA